MHALIFGDNKYQTIRTGILRAPGAHRIATHLRKQNIDIEVVDFYLDWSIEELKQIIDCQLNKPTLFIGFSCSLMFDGVQEFKGLFKGYIDENTPYIVNIGNYFFPGVGKLNREMIKLIKKTYMDITELQHNAPIEIKCKGVPRFNLFSSSG
jgi:hypothetical protein